MLGYLTLQKFGATEAHKRPESRSVVTFSIPTRSTLQTMPLYSHNRTRPTNIPPTTATRKRTTPRTVVQIHVNIHAITLCF